MLTHSHTHTRTHRCTLTHIYLNTHNTHALLECTVIHTHSHTHTCMGSHKQGWAPTTTHSQVVCLFPSCLLMPRQAGEAERQTHTGRCEPQGWGAHLVLTPLDAGHSGGAGRTALRGAGRVGKMPPLICLDRDHCQDQTRTDPETPVLLIKKKITPRFVEGFQRVGCLPGTLLRPLSLQNRYCSVPASSEGQRRPRTQWLGPCCLSGRGSARVGTHCCSAPGSAGLRCS